MEKPSGLKECPRCGLRNRPGAYQCEFCGWDFGVASDDWMGQINDLEKLGQDVGTPTVDEDTASKIESTITKPAEAVSERSVDADMSLLEEPDFGDTAAAEPIYEAVPTEEAIAESILGPYVEESPEAPMRVKARGKPAVAAEVETEAVPVAAAASNFELPLVINAGVLVAGVAALAAALLLVTGGTLDKPAGWITTIIGSFLTVFAISRLLPSLGNVLPVRKKADAKEQK